jgi:hypothetical protein
LAKLHICLKLAFVGLLLLLEQLLIIVSIQFSDRFQFQPF